MANEALINRLYQMIDEIARLGGEQERTSIVPGILVVDASPSDLPTGWIKIVNPRDGTYVPCQVVAGLVVNDNDLVNVLFTKGTEPIALSQSSGSPSSSVKVSELWESDFGAVAWQTDADGNLGNLGVGITPAVPLDLLGSNADGLRIRGTDSANEIADLYVGSSGQFIINLKNGTDSAQFLEILTEDDNFGILIRESDGTGTAAYANLFVTDDTIDHLNITVTAAQTTAGLVLTSNHDVGIGTKTPTTISSGAATGRIFNLYDGTNAAEFALQGTSGGAKFNLVDLAGAVGQKWAQAFFDGDYFKWRSLSDDGSSVVSNNIIIFQASTGYVAIGNFPSSAQLLVDQPSTTAAIPVIQLDQADLSEEFINFIAASTGSGDPVDTVTAVGTAYARLRVAVNGTFKYIQLYNA